MKVDPEFSSTPTRDSPRSYIDDERLLEQRMRPVQHNVRYERHPHPTGWPRVREPLRDEDGYTYTDDRTTFFTETSITTRPVQSRDTVSSKSVSETEKHKNCITADVLNTLSSVRSLNRRVKKLEVDGALPYLVKPVPRPPTFLVHTGSGAPIVVDGKGPVAMFPSVSSNSTAGLASDVAVVGLSNCVSSSSGPSISTASTATDAAVVGLSDCMSSMSTSSPATDEDVVDESSYLSTDPSVSITSSATDAATAGLSNTVYSMSTSSHATDAATVGLSNTVYSKSTNSHATDAATVGLSNTVYSKSTSRHATDAATVGLSNSTRSHSTVEPRRHAVCSDRGKTSAADAKHTEATDLDGLESKCQRRVRFTNYQPAYVESVSSESTKW